MNKVYKTVLSVLVPAIVLILVLVIRHQVVTQDTFSLVKYTIVSVSGVDGRGTATVSVDEVGLYAALAGSNATADEKNAYYNFVSSIKVSLDRAENLSNGDDVLVTVSYNEQEAEKVKIKIDKTERTQKITGLVEGTKLDLFEHVKIITTGVSPYISVSYVNEAENTYLSTLQYDISATKNLAIGDKITISCEINEEEAAAQGYFYDDASMDYTITVADYYVTNPDEFPNDVMVGIVRDAVSAIETATKDTRSHMSYTLTGENAYLYRDGNENAINFQYIGMVNATNSTGSALEHDTYALIFLKGQLQLPNYNGSEDPYDYLDAYFCFLYSDPIITTDGNFCMATNDPSARFVCSSNYESCLQEARNKIGPGYSYSELVMTELDFSAIEEEIPAESQPEETETTIANE